MVGCAHLLFPGESCSWGVCPASLFLDPPAGGSFWSHDPSPNPRSCTKALLPQRQRESSFVILVYNEELLSLPGPVTSFWPCGKQLLSPQTSYPSAGLILQCVRARLYQLLSVEMLCFGSCCLMLLHADNAGTAAYEEDVTSPCSVPAAVPGCSVNHLLHAKCWQAISRNIIKRKSQLHSEISATWNQCSC